MYTELSLQNDYENRLIVYRIHNSKCLRNKNKYFNSIFIAEALDENSMKAMAKLLKSTNIFIDFKVTRFCQNIWNILNNGISLKKIYIGGDNFNLQRSGPKFYKLNNLISLTLQDRSDYKHKFNYMKTKFAKTIKFASLNIFEYSYLGRIDKNKQIVVTGNVKQNDFKKHENIQALFSLNITFTTCSFRITYANYFSRTWYRFYINRILRNLSVVEFTKFPFKLFHQNDA